LTVSLPSTRWPLPFLQYVGRSFHASPRQLGFITLACALVQAVCAPVGGLLGHYLNRWGGEGCVRRQAGMPKPPIPPA
jgi:hypothetical protein